MKIALVSDVHLEFGDLKLKNTEDADVLILSGDICVAADLMDFAPLTPEPMRFGKSDRYHEFFRTCSNEFAHVLYVAGNHEHYHGDFKTTISELKSKLGYLKNLHILDKETFTLNDVTFVGGTLWTDMNDRDPVTMTAIRNMMNDFRIIKNSNKMVSYKTYFPDPEDNTKEVMKFKERPATFCPQDAVEDHDKMLAYIQHVVEGKYEQKFVVVGHHTPSHVSCHPRYKDDNLMNGGYHSNLYQFILDRPQIKLWTHGHTHELFDYQLGSTRVVCNPRGYDGYEDIADNFTLKYVEV
jgi:predicted phosphodiesterase